MEFHQIQKWRKIYWKTLGPQAHSTLREAAGQAGPGIFIDFPAKKVGSAYENINSVNIPIFPSEDISYLLKLAIFSGSHVKLCSLFQRYVWLCQ